MCTTSSPQKFKSPDQPHTSQSLKECIVLEKQFKLVEEEFSQVMRTLCPEVQIMEWKTNKLVLRGPDKEVQSGAVKLDELIKRMVEKRVMLPEDLLAFIRSSGAFSKYQTDFQSFRNPVSLEVGSHLLLSSLSSDALDEALAAVLRGLSVEIVKLLGAAAVSPDLDRVKEILNKAKNEENRGEIRVDVSFISGTSVTKVRLVGYSENVNKLKEVLHDYQFNQIQTQEVLILPHPEMADCFDKILDLTDMKQTKVTLRASHSPHPCVLVSGPRYHVQQAKQALTSSLANLTSDTLILDGGQALHYFQTQGELTKKQVEKSNHVLIRERKGVNSSRSQYSHSQRVLKPSLSRWFSKTLQKNNKINLKIGLGSLMDEQVDVLVVPMLNRILTSTKIGKCLLSKAGNAMSRNFELMAANCTLGHGNVLQVDAPPSLGCSKVFFIECLPWDGIGGWSVQQGWSSVALPVIGPDMALKYPLGNASQVLVDRICQIGSSASSGSLSTIHIVIKPDPGAEECYHDVYRRLNVNMNQGGQGIPESNSSEHKAVYKSLTSDLDDFTVTVRGGVKLQVVFGDITNETTDAVVNTTDFTNFKDGVCKDILPKAGPQVEQILKMAKVNQGAVFKTPPGSFPCKAILHVCGERNTGIIELLVYNIIQRCETYGYKSVAIPAICASVGGLDPGLVAHAILHGIKTSTSSRPPLCLTSIRLVLIKINVFLAFKSQAMQMFAPAEINKVSDPQLPLEKQQPSVSTKTGLNILLTSSTSKRSAFLVLGLCREKVDDAMTKLKDLYQSQCSTKTFTKEDLADLTQSDMEQLRQLVETQGLYVQVGQPGQGDLMVSGLKDGVMLMLQTITALRREVRVRKEEDDLYTRVSWCILGSHHSWKRLPKTANHNLENDNVTKGIVDAEGISWSVDLQKMEAKSLLTRQTAKLKRLENQTDFLVPLYWDNMTPGEKLRVVPLQPSSPDYSEISKAFKQSVAKTIVKIERLQNIRLRQMYEVQKKHMDVHGRGAGEKRLFHGTSQVNCDSIINNGFNRSFSGKNATAYGHGTYFAVNASYSASPTYATPAADGTQIMFVAQVLTGTYTQGSSNMRVPPPRNVLQPHDLYDSVVDRTDNPSIYVIFSDIQAYPDYLITFR